LTVNTDETPQDNSIVYDGSSLKFWNGENFEGITGGGSTDTFAIIANSYSALAASYPPASYNGKVALVLLDEGILLAKKPKGIYYSDGTTWSWKSGYVVAYNDSETFFHDDADTTKLFGFELSGIASGNTRILSVPDKDGTIATFDDIPTNADEIAVAAGTFNGTVLTDTEDDIQKAVQALDDVLDGTISKNLTFNGSLTVNDDYGSVTSALNVRGNVFANLFKVDAQNEIVYHESAGDYAYIFRCSANNYAETAWSPEPGTYYPTLGWYGDAYDGTLSMWSYSLGKDMFGLYGSMEGIDAFNGMKWTASGSGTNEYYAEASAGGDPSLSEDNLEIVIAPHSPDAYRATKATVGSLAAGEWGYGDNDTLGFNTVYIRLTDGADPDTEGNFHVVRYKPAYIANTGYVMQDYELRKYGSGIALGYKALADELTFGSDVYSANIYPSVDNASYLGSETKRYKDAYFSGKVNFGSSLYGSGSEVHINNLGIDFWDGTTSQNYGFEISGTNLMLWSNSESYEWSTNGTYYFGYGQTFDGSSSAPAYTFQNDTDTGMYRDGTNKLGFASAGTLLMFIAQGITQHNQKQISYSNISANGYVVKTVGQAVASSNTTAPASSLWNSPSINPGFGTWSVTPIGIAGNRCGLVNNSSLTSAASLTGATEFYAYTQFDTAITGGGSLAVTNLYGYYYQNPAALGTNVSVTNAYGLYVEAPTRGGTLNVGILNNGDLEQASGTEYRIGDGSTNGTWRSYVNANGYLVDSTRVSGTYQDYLWNDYNIAAIALATGAAAPDKVTVNGATYIEGYAFDGNATTESLSGVIEILHGYVEGSDLRPHVHWAPTTTGTGNVKWQMEYTIANADGTFSTPTTITITDAAGGTAWQSLVAEFATISGTGLEIGAQVHFSIFRDPSDVADTYAGDALLSSVGVHVQVESAGSINVFAK